MNHQSEDYNLKTSNYTFYFYRFYQANSGYVFKGWATSSTANSGDYNSKIGLTATSDNNTSGKPKTGTYYAIFARLAADKNSLSFSVNRPNTEEKTITISHSHAGNVKATLSGNDANQFSLSGSTSFTSTSENTATVTVKYAPTCNGSHFATLTISSDNGLNSVSIPISGTAVLNKQSLSWNDEPIDTNIQVGETNRQISATATSGLKVTYSSDDPNVLSVDADGNLTAKSEGTATITASQAGVDCIYEAATSITKTFTVNEKKTPSFWLENNPDLAQKDLMVDGTTYVNIANIDASSLTIDYDNNLLDYAYNATTGIATITAKNEGTATLTFTQTETTSVLPASRTFTFNISKHQGTLSINSNLGDTYKVDDEIGDYTSFYTASNNEVQVKVESSNSNVIAIENNKLKAVGAGKATITFSQAETYKWVSTTASKEITVDKYTISASINQSTANWGETISNPFTVIDDRKNNFSGYSVTAVNPSIADYVNGQIVTYSTDGKAQFTISYGETAKYNALSKTVDLSVAAAAESECYVVSQLDEITINNNTFNFNGGIGETLTCHLSGSTGWTPAVGTITITGNKADGSSTTLLTSKSKEFRNGIDKTIPLNSDITSITISYSGSYNAYVTNLKVTRLNDLNANATSVEALGVPDGNPSRSFSVNYSDCGSTFTVRSSNPKITVSPATFNVSAGNGTQTITFTGNTQATGKETATITVYNQSRKVEVDVTCYQQYKISFVTGQGASTINPLIVTYDKAYTLPANPTKAGYTFAGWQKDGEKFVKGDKYSFTNDITLTAHWEAKTYNLTLNYNDNSSLKI